MLKMALLTAGGLAGASSGVSAKSEESIGVSAVSESLRPIGGAGGELVGEGDGDEVLEACGAGDDASGEGAEE